MPQFRKKPVVITAVRLQEPDSVQTLEGKMEGNPGDWKITGVKGEQYFCKDDIFRKTYEAVDDEGETALLTTPAYPNREIPDFGKDQKP